MHLIPQTPRESCGVGSGVRVLAQHPEPGRASVPWPVESGGGGLSWFMAPRGSASGGLHLLLPGAGCGNCCLPVRPSVHPRGRWTAAAWALHAGSRVGAMLHGATVGALPNPDGGWVWEEVLGKSRPRHPPEPGAERQLKHEPPGNTRVEFNSVHAAWGWH